jgi:hypothetical protein
MRRADLAHNPRSKKAARTTQIIFGERQHLLRVLDSLEQSDVAPHRLKEDRRALESLIVARTRELDSVNPGWDQKVSLLLSPDVTPQQLDRMSQEAPARDYYLLRLISEHPKASAKTLARLARHEYGAVRENVARHPNADAATLVRLSRDRSQPLWYLVAFNPNTPQSLRRKLQEKMRRLGEKAPAK